MQAGTSAPAVPHGWEQIGCIPIGPRVQLGFQVAGIALLGAIVALGELGPRSRRIVEVFLSTQHAGLICLAGFAACVVAHEATHGLAALGFGLRPRFGVGRVGVLPCAWCTTDAIFHRLAFCVCSLAPLVLLNALAVFLLTRDALALVGYAILVANTLGAVADVWCVAYLARFPPGSAVLESRAANLIVRPI